MDSRKESSKPTTKGGKPAAGPPKGSNSGASKHAPKGGPSKAAPAPKSCLSAAALAALDGFGPAPVLDLSKRSMAVPSVKPALSVQKWMQHVTNGAPVPACERSHQEAEVRFITGADFIKHFPLVQKLLNQGVRFYFLGKNPEDTTFDGLIEKAGAPTEVVDGVTVHYFCKHALSHCKFSLPGGGFKKHVASGCAHIEFTGDAGTKSLSPTHESCICLDVECPGQVYGVACAHFPYAFHPVNGTDHFGVKVTHGQLVCSLPLCPGDCKLAHAPPKDVAAFAAKLAQLKIKPSNSAEDEALTACAAAIKAVGPSRLKDLTQLLTEVAANVMALVNALKPTDLGHVVQALDDPEALVTVAAAQAVSAINGLSLEERVAVTTIVRRSYAEALKTPKQPTPVQAPKQVPVVAPVTGYGSYRSKHFGAWADEE